MNSIHDPTVIHTQSRYFLRLENTLRQLDPLSGGTSNLVNYLTSNIADDVREIISFIERSEDNKQVILNLVNTNDIRKIKYIGHLLALSECTNSKSESDSYVTFLSNLYPDTKLKDSEYMKILSLHIPHHLIESLLEKNLFDKFLTFSLVKFWDSNHFPWTNSEFLDSLSEASNSKEFYFMIMTKLPLTPIEIEEHTEIESGLFYSLSTENFAAAYGFGNQRRFNLQVQATISEAFNHIKNGKWEFEHFLVFFAYRRYQIATDAKMVDAAYYGDLSSIQIQTWCTGVYQHLEDRLEELGSRNNSKNLTKNHLSEIEYHFQGISVGLITNRCLKKVFVHSHPKNLSSLLPYIKKAFKNALAAKDDDSLLNSLAEFFWIFCMAKPCNKGEVTIAEMFIKSIFISHYNNTKSFNWKEGIIPWCEVICEPDPDEFIKKFNTLIDIVVSLES